MMERYFGYSSFKAGLSIAIILAPARSAPWMPGQVIGKNVVVIANLKSTVLRGVESNGMLLAGKQGKDIELVEVNGLEPGCRIS